MPKNEEPYAWLDKPIEDHRRRAKAIAGIVTLAAAFSAGAAISRYRRQRPVVAGERPAWKPEFDPAAIEQYRESIEVFRAPLSEPIHNGLLAVLGYLMVEQQPLTRKELDSFALAVTPKLNKNLLASVRGYGIDYELFGYNQSGDLKGYWTAGPAGLWLAQPEQSSVVPELHEVMARLSDGQLPFSESL